MKLKIMIFGILLYALSGYSQQVYYENIHRADSLSIVKNYFEAGKVYLKIYGPYKKNFTENDLYNAASYLSLARQVDHSFIFLDALIKERDYSEVDDLIEDKSFINIRKNKKWNELIAIAKLNKLRIEKNYDQKLKAELETIYKDDQKYRQRLDITGNKFGEQSKEFLALQREMTIADKSNLKKVVKILDQYGWVGPKKVGGKASQALYIVIQHADDDPNLQIKYLEMFRKAIISGVSDEIINYAFLSDRVSLYKNKYQIFGTQLRKEKNGNFKPLPIKDEKNVDKRRQEVGLGPLRYYLQLNKLLSQRI